MDAFSRTLAAAALVDGQYFTLPGVGTIEGVYISARIDHAARLVEAPRLDVRWQTEEDPSAQTFADLLVSTGATTQDAQEIQMNWLDALASGNSINIGDLGALAPNSTTGVCSFEPNTEALAAAFSGNRALSLEPISKRALPSTNAGPVGAPDAGKGNTASAKTKPSFVRQLVPYVSAAALVLLGVLAINFFSRSPTIDASKGKVVTVNQERLNKSPREEATTADLPIERIEEDSPSEIVAGEPFSQPIDEDGPSTSDNIPTQIIEDKIEEILPDAKVESARNERIPPSKIESTSSQDIQPFDPAALAGLADDEQMFAFSEIDVVIVLGSFGNSNNAALLTEKVAAAGLVPYVDQPGELTRVGATFSVSSEAEIEEVKQRMRKQFNPKAWVLE